MYFESKWGGGGREGHNNETQCNDRTKEKSNKKYSCLREKNICNIVHEECKCKVQIRNG